MNVLHGVTKVARNRWFTSYDYCDDCHIVLLCCFTSFRKTHLKVVYKPQNTLWRREMTVMASRITGQSGVCSAVYSRTAKKHQRSALVSLCDGNQCQHKGTVKRKLFLFDDVTMYTNVLVLLFSIQSNRSCSASTIFCWVALLHGAKRIRIMHIIIGGTDGVDAFINVTGIQIELDSTYKFLFCLIT